MQTLYRAAIAANIILVSLYTSSAIDIFLFTSIYVSSMVLEYCIGHMIENLVTNEREIEVLKAIDKVFYFLSRIYILAFLTNLEAEGNIDKNSLSGAMIFSIQYINRLYVNFVVGLTAVCSIFYAADKIAGGFVLLVTQHVLDKFREATGKNAERRYKNDVKTINKITPLLNAKNSTLPHEDEDEDENKEKSKTDTNTNTTHGTTDINSCAVCLSRVKRYELHRIMPCCKLPFHAACCDSWLMVTLTCPGCSKNLV
jgi:hypothetical protein